MSQRIWSKTAWFLLSISMTAIVVAEDWAQFRGPTGQGETRDAAPTQWSQTENVAWRTPLPNPGNGSPIVVGNKVLLCSANEEGTVRSLLCFQREDGKLLWTRDVEFGEKEPTHKTNPHGATTPASDGEHVVVSHGSAGLFCYDLQGELKWSVKPGTIRHMWGYASSPVIHNERVIVNLGPGATIALAAYSLKDGSELFKTVEPQEGDGERNASQKYMGSWSTPVLADVGGKTQVVCTFPTRVNGYDPESGELIWSCQGIRGQRGDLAYTSPHVAGRRVVAIGGYQGPGIGFNIEGRGDLTEARLWRAEQNPQAIGSGVIVGDHLFIGFAGANTIECIETATGERTWQQRTQSGAHWASTILANGLLYATGQNGTTVVFKPNADKFEQVAENSLKETCNATPAVSNGQIFIRTYKALYCIR